MDKPILCLDFDGVIHRYSRGWQDGTIYDEMVDGFFEWAAQAQKHFDLVIYSSRSATVEGRLAMGKWLAEHLRQWRGEHITFAMASEKPPAFLTIDDRAMQFRGQWNAWWLEPERLLAFKPWTSGEQEPCSETQ
jgi:hypothetical protein